MDPRYIVADKLVSPRNFPREIFDHRTFKGFSSSSSSFFLLFLRLQHFILVIWNLLKFNLDQVVGVKIGMELIFIGIYYFTVEGKRRKNLILERVISINKN